MVSTEAVRSLHWSDLHRMLIDALPPGTVRFGHTVTGIEQPGGDSVNVTASVVAPRGDGGEGGGPIAGKPRVEGYRGDLAVAADGQMSQTRQRNAPQGDTRRCPRTACCIHLRVASGHHPRPASPAW